MLFLLLVCIDGDLQLCPETIERNLLHTRIDDVKVLIVAGSSGLHDFSNKNLLETI